jgi:hypothetical protein
MCGPCIKTGQPSCNARSGNTDRIKTACTYCHAGKKTCSDPRPQWAKPIFDAMLLSMYSNSSHCFLLITIAPSLAGGGTSRHLIYMPGYAHMHIGLDEETRRQLNRLEAMLNAICDNEGIIPSTLPGYELPRSASPSTQSMSSVGAPLERLHLSDATSEPPRKLGKCLCAYSTSCDKFDLCTQPEQAAPPPEDVPAVVQALTIRVDRP